MNGWLTPMDYVGTKPHRCGRCSNPFMENRSCPNAPKPTPHINILAAPLDAMFTDEEAAAVLTEWMNE